MFDFCHSLIFFKDIFIFPVTVTHNFRVSEQRLPIGTVIGLLFRQNLGYPVVVLP